VLSAIGDAAGSSVTTVDQADMRALVSTRLLCVTELPRSRLWGVGLIRSNNVCRGFSDRERTASPIELFGISRAVISFEDLTLRVLAAIRWV
jgi:hypothetical protein